MIKNVKNKHKTAGELLVSFLKFYRWRYLPRCHVAVVNGPQPNKYFYSVNDIDKVFSASYCDKKGGTPYEFTVCDPFNNTYNPAKV